MRSAHTSADDWKAAADLLGEISAADSFAELDHLAPPLLRRLFRADLVVWERFANNLRHRAFRLEPAPEAAIGPLHAAFELHFHEHPGFSHFTEGLAAGMVFLLSDFASTRRFVQTGLWREAYQHLRAKHQLGFSGRLDSGTILAGSLNRLGHDFGPRDRELARFMRPRLVQLAVTIRRRETGTQMAGILGDFFCGQDASFARIAPDGRILEISASARASLARAAPGGMLHAHELPETCTELRAALRHGADPRGRQTRFRVVRVGSGVGALVLHAAKAAEGAMVLFQDEPVAGAGRTPKLTRREAEIVAWIGEGKSNREIATLLGISTRTVGKHCENVFAKLGVSSRMGAALLSRA